MQAWSPRQNGVDADQARKDRAVSVRRRSASLRTPSLTVRSAWTQATIRVVKLTTKTMMLMTRYRIVCCMTVYGYSLRQYIPTS